MARNQEVTPDEIQKIRGLDDFDLVMLISDVHDHGWPVARRTLALMPPGNSQGEHAEGEVSA